MGETPDRAGVARLLIGKIKTGAKTKYLGC